MQKLAKDPRFVGGDIGMMGGLHTWKRDMSYHPHVHYIAAGGGLSADRSQWLSCKKKFFVPVQSLSVIFRAKFRDALKKTDLFDEVPHCVWENDWVIHCKPVGSGEKALTYLAPYIYRVAITNNRIESCDNGEVTYRFKNSRTDQWETKTLPGFDFMHRFLQHVLPKGFVKIRYYGFMAPGRRNLLAVALYLLGASKPLSVVYPVPKKDHLCPCCGSPLRLIKPLGEVTRAPPWRRRCA